MKKLAFIACTAMFLSAHLPANAQANPDSSHITRTTTTDSESRPDYSYLGLLGLLGLFGLRGLRRKTDVVVDNRFSNPNDKVVR